MTATNIYSTMDSSYGSTGRENMSEEIVNEPYIDPLFGIMGETYLDRYFARKGLSNSNDGKSDLLNSRSSLSKFYDASINMLIGLF
jgi:hypothetical protein